VILQNPQDMKLMHLEIIIFLITLSPAKLVQLPGPEKKKKKTAGIWERKLLNWNGLLYIIAIFSPRIPCNICCLLPSSSTHLKMYGVINFGANKSHWKYWSVWLCVCVCAHACVKSPTGFIVCIIWGIHKKLFNRTFNFSTQNFRLLITRFSSKTSNRIFVIQVICLRGPRRDRKCQSAHSKLENHYRLLLLNVLASHNKASLVLGVSKLFSKDNVKNGFKRATQRDNMIIWFPW